MYDIVFIQEHWLAPHNLQDVQDTCPDMPCLTSSAMSDVMSEKVWKGTPFGGVDILVNNTVRLATGAKLKFVTERYIIVELFDLVLINVRIPCSSVANSRCCWQRLNNHEL